MIELHRAITAATAANEYRTPTAVPKPVMHRHVANRPELSTAERPAAVVNGELSASEQKILDALAWWEAVGVTTIDKGVLAVIAGYTIGGRFNNLIGSMRTKGLIDYPGVGQAAFTDAGRSAANHPGRLGTLADLHAAWQSKLEPSQGKIVEQIIAIHPGTIEVEELDVQLGYTVGGRFNNLLASLRSMGVVTKRNPVGATELLFPAGLRYK